MRASLSLLWGIPITWWLCISTCICGIYNTYYGDHMWVSWECVVTKKDVFIHSMWLGEAKPSVPGSTFSPLHHTGSLSYKIVSHMFWWVSKLQTNGLVYFHDQFICSLRQHYHMYPMGRECWHMGVLSWGSLVGSIVWKDTHFISCYLGNKTKIHIRNFFSLCV